MTWFRRKVYRVVITTRCQQTWVFERHDEPFPGRDLRQFKQLAQMSKSGMRGGVDINIDYNEKGGGGSRKVPLRYEDVASVDFE